jgi:hypothetical protein
MLTLMGKMILLVLKMVATELNLQRLCVLESERAD